MYRDAATESRMAGRFHLRYRFYPTRQVNPLSDVGKQLDF